MAADTTAALAGLQVRGAAHTLNGSAGGVDCLKVQRLAGGCAEVSGAVGFHGNRAQEHSR
jgi:hypothetical protein